MSCRGRVACTCFGTTTCRACGRTTVWYLVMCGVVAHAGQPLLPTSRRLHAARCLTAWHIYVSMPVRPSPMDMSAFLCLQVSQTYFMALSTTLLACLARLFACNLHLGGRLLEVHGALLRTLLVRKAVFPCLRQAFFKRVRAGWRLMTNTQEWLVFYG